MIKRVYFSWILRNYSSTLLARSAWMLLLGSECIRFSSPFLIPAVWSLVVLCITVTRWVLSFFGTYKSYERSYKNILQNDWKYWLCIICLSLILLQPLCTLSLSGWSHTIPLPDVFWLLGRLTFGSSWTLFELAYSQSKGLHLLKVRRVCAAIQTAQEKLQLKANTTAA